MDPKAVQKVTEHQAEGIEDAAKFLAWGTECMVVPFVELGDEEVVCFTAPQKP